MPTLFTKIIQGEIPCHKILEDDNYLAFLDIKPINEGHALVIPKREVDYIFDLDDELLSGIMAFSKKVAGMIKKVSPCKRIGIMVCGLEVPHAHIHLVPINDISDMSFAKARLASNEDLAKTAERIRSVQA